MSLRDGVLVIEGWCIPSKSDKIIYSVTDTKGNPMKCTAVARDRVDVAQQFGADRMSGFTVAIPFERDQDAWLVMNDGGIMMSGTPAEVFSRVGELRSVGLGIPQTAELLHMMREAGYDVRTDIFGVEECADEIARVLAE